MTNVNFCNSDRDRSLAHALRFETVGESFPICDGCAAHTSQGFVIDKAFKSEVFYFEKIMGIRLAPMDKSLNNFTS